MRVCETLSGHGPSWDTDAHHQELSLELRRSEEGPG